MGYIVLFITPQNNDGLHPEVDFDKDFFFKPVLVSTLEAESKAQCNTQALSSLNVDSVAMAAVLPRCY